MTRNRSSRPDPQSIHDLDPTTPHTNAQPFADILAARLTRRDTLRGGLSLAASAWQTDSTCGVYNIYSICSM